jgi:SNF family Na+-dependent transporter
MVGPLVGCMFLSYVFTYFSVWKGLKSTGKMVYFTCLLPYVILTILFIKGLTLDGAGVGLGDLFTPDWSYLGQALVWKNAATQILFSSGVSYGPLMYYGTGR